MNFSYIKVFDYALSLPLIYFCRLFQPIEYKLKFTRMKFKVVNVWWSYYRENFLLKSFSSTINVFMHSTAYPCGSIERKVEGKNQFFLSPQTTQKQVANFLAISQFIIQCKWNFFINFFFHFPSTEWRYGYVSTIFNVSFTGMLGSHKNPDFSLTSNVFLTWQHLHAWMAHWMCGRK